MENYGGKLSHFSFDLSNDIFSFPEKIDVLLHVAAAVPSSTQNDENFFQINFEGSKRLIENINFSNEAKILNISTSSVYDDPLADILDENSQKTSHNAYGLSKLFFERYIDEKFNGTNIKVLSCRIPVLLVKDIKNNFTSQNMGTHYKIIIGPINNETANKLVSTFISKGYKENELIFK